ncbi:hypothetical protein QR680_019381 [Steinernema hermaphroditum]|uniref:Uncharacterized protein n=1 Tax=Steinernema hermaphroditum TaxID=289476 RepID=A0AA39GN25_9BILA|nr:hypothetical protein QR680_019381 [Steinernema hermaphroditum]
MDVSDDVVASFGEIFESAPSDSQTPTRFSGFIENYLKIFGEKRESVGTRLNRLRAGVSKLTETRDGGQGSSYQGNKLCALVELWPCSAVT